MKKLYIFTLACFVTNGITWCMERDEINGSTIGQKRALSQIDQFDSDDEKESPNNHAEFEESIKKRLNQKALYNARCDLQDWIKFCNANLDTSILAGKIPIMWNFYKTLESELTTSGHKKMPASTLKTLSKLTIACGHNPNNYKQ